MKFSCLLLASLCSSALAVAQVAPTGYCRIQNVSTQRYLYVMDNTSTKADFSAGTFDCGAIVPFSGLSKAISDPASVIDIVYVSGYQYRFDAQGTSTTQIVGNYPVNLSKYRDAFLCYATYSGLTRYLADVTDDLTQERGSIDVKTEDSNARSWNIIKIDVNSDNYFGIKPTIEVDGKYYAPFYASFAFSTASDGMKVYMISAQKGGKAILSQVSADVIPGGFPVLIECASTDPANNKINILSSSTSVLDGNKLVGNYFNNRDIHPITGEDILTYEHRNVTNYNTATDRIFGVTSDGKLGLITPTDEYIPGNFAFLQSSEDNLPSEIVFVSKGDPNGDGAVNISDVTSTIDVIANSSLDSSFKDVYDINGDDVVNIADVTSLINKISNE